MMRIHKLNTLLPALSLTLLLAACGSNDSSSTDPKENKKEEKTSYTVTDDTNKEITFDEVPETVVSLQPSNTEILFALGEGEKVTGVTEYDYYPEEAKNIERVSDSMIVNTEAVLNLDPDAVIAYTTGDEANLKVLEDAGIPVFVIESASSIDDVYGDIEQIAAVMGIEEKGKELVAEIEEQIQAVKDKTSTLSEKEKVYFEISPSPDIFTAGADTFQQDLLVNAGIENIFADETGWVKASEEEIVKRNPSVILTTVNYIENPVAEIKSRSSWSDIKAVKNNKVYQLDADVMSRPGPRIGEAIELAAKTVYPELFN